MPNFKSYIICTSPRSGSTLLCHLLGDTGRAGAPNSHFHEPSLAAWRGYYDIPPNITDENTCRRAIFTAALKKGQGGTGIFGMRIQQESHAFFLQQLKAFRPNSPNDVARIEDIFGRTLYIYLTRQTKLDQAISLEKALQSGLWHKHGDGRELERSAPHQDPVYNGAAILDHLEASIVKEQAWAEWFTAQSIAPLRITYEDLSAEPFQTRNRIIQALGQTWKPPAFENPPVAKLADETSVDWALRFRDDYPSKVVREMSTEF